jgi:hypothetical protein
LDNSTPPDPGPFPEDQAKAVITALVKKRLYGMFAPYQGRWGIDDLVSEGLMAARAQWPKYDRTRAAASTFLYQRARSRIFDILRGENRRQRRDHIACELKPEVQAPPTLPDMDPFEWSADVPLVEWFAGVYRASRTFYAGGRHKQGRRFYNAGQVSAIGALALRLKLSTRGCRLLLLERDDLRRAIHLKRVPTQQYLCRVIRISRNFRDAHYPHLLSETLPAKRSELLSHKTKRLPFFVPARRAG